MRPTAAATLLIGTVLLLSSAAGAAAGERKPLPWWRSSVVGHDRVVRMLIRFGAADSVVRRADVKGTEHQVRIGLWRDHATKGNFPAIAYVQCVEVHLRFRVAGRQRIDANFNRSPDRGARGGQRLLRGDCRKLRVRYEPRNRGWRAPAR